MSFQVGATYSGRITITDHQAGTRFDLTIELADAAARQVADLIDTGASTILARVECLEGRAFRFAGNADQARQLVEDFGKAIDFSRDVLKAIAEIDAEEGA